MMMKVFNVNIKEGKPRKVNGTYITHTFKIHNIVQKLMIYFKSTRISIIRDLID